MPNIIRDRIPVGSFAAALYNSAKVADLLAGGWQTNGILTFAQGQFQTLNLGSDWILVGSLNHTQFGSANLNTQSAAFGAITSTRLPRAACSLGER